MESSVAPVEHRVGSVGVIIDVNEQNFPGHNYRQIIFRVRRPGGVVSVYRCNVSAPMLPADNADDTAAYLLTQAHHHSLIFSYRELPAVR